MQTLAEAKTKDCRTPKECSILPGFHCVLEHILWILVGLVVFVYFVFVVQMVLKNYDDSSYLGFTILGLLGIIYMIMYFYPSDWKADARWLNWLCTFDFLRVFVRTSSVIRFFLPFLWLVFLLEVVM